uniref:Uncharacterized protein n=1 Tax=Octopus bimaculoides TaxID=37653 RepID=A0A0L8I8V3_OCTBM
MSSLSILHFNYFSYFSLFCTFLFLSHYPHSLSISTQQLYTRFIHSSTSLLLNSSTSGRLHNHIKTECCFATQHHHIRPTLTQITIIATAGLSSPFYWKNTNNSSLFITTQHHF